MPASTPGRLGARLGCALLWLILTSLAMGCPRREAPRREAGPPADEAEQRFGNDPELVADFEALARCPLDASGLDWTCPEVEALRLRLQTKQRSQELRERLRATLTNLLESRKDRTRLMVAHHLDPHLEEAQVRTALDRALARETIPAIKAMLLRQACRIPTERLQAQSRSLLSSKVPEVVRVEAVVCLGRRGPPSELTLQALRKVLGADPSARVRGQACLSLGALGDEGSATLMASALASEPGLEPCASALASLPARTGLPALLGQVRRILSAAGTLPPQVVPALASLARSSGTPSDHDAVQQLLTELSAATSQPTSLRELARAELDGQGAAGPVSTSP